MHRTAPVALLAAVTTSLALGASAATAAEYDADTVIVKYRGAASAAAIERLSARVGLGRTIGTVQGVGASIVRVSSDPAVVAARLERSLLVDYAEPDVTLQATARPNDPRFGELYGIDNANDADLDGPEAWDLAGIGAFPATGGVKVGIIDTGIDQNHEDLVGKTVACAQSSSAAPLLAGSLREGSCLDDNDHGTHVAGTVAALANNGKGVAGVAFNAPLVICKALGGPLGTGSTSDVANCINWTASKGSRIISMSLGGGSSTTLQRAVQSAYNGGNGALVIAAAGNDGNGTLNYPAAYAEVVSVAATDRNDARASFSNANADVEIAAAGVGVLSTRRGGGYFALSGTSMATPHVAGAAAVVAAKLPTLTAAGIRSRLNTTADDKGAAGRDPQFGFGRVNLANAVR